MSNKILIHDLGKDYDEKFENSVDTVINADGRYAPCQGCFHCWTKTPATCELGDSLQEICRVLGQADDLTIITENWYGGHSPNVKNILDRSIGQSKPTTTLRDMEMHHCLRYGKHNKLKVIAYGDMTGKEEATWDLMTGRNAVNLGYTSHEFIHVDSKEDITETDII
jgi:multimeric flavodoxin WrbA